VSSRDDWRLTSTDEIEPLGPLPKLHPHDQLIRAALEDRELPWTDLRAALTRAGMAPAAAALAIYKSPLLRRRGRSRYGLIGRRVPSPG